MVLIIICYVIYINGEMCNTVFNKKIKTQGNIMLKFFVKNSYISKINLSSFRNALLIIFKKLNNNKN